MNADGIPLPDTNSIFLFLLTEFYIPVWTISRELFLENKARGFLHFNTKRATDKVLSALTKTSLKYWGVGSNFFFFFFWVLPFLGTPQMCENILNKTIRRSRREESRTWRSSFLNLQVKGKTEIRQLLLNATNCWWKTGKRSGRTGEDGAYACNMINYSNLLRDEFGGTLL